ncbi:major facilitator superfamily-domain-containing protein, partial [Cyathus striatus]
YIAYAPQLGERLHITHTQLNIVAITGNVGVYMTGPILGRLVDTCSPRILILSASILLFLGYGGIKAIYNTGLPPNSSPETTLPFGRFLLLVLCSFLTGAGGDARLMSAVNTTAKTFPEHARASTTGLVISGFGLSAFLFSTIAHVFYAGNTTAFLGILTLGTSLPMILGFFVCPIPLPEPTSPDIDDGGEEEMQAMLDHDHLAPRHAHVGTMPTYEVDFHKDLENLDEGIEMAPLGSLKKGVVGGVSITRGKLWRTGDFWLLFGILSLGSFPSPGTRILFPLPPLRSTFTLLCVSSLSFMHICTSIPFYTLYLPTYLLSSSYHFPPRTFTSSLFIPPSSLYHLLPRTTFLLVPPSFSYHLPPRTTFLLAPSSLQLPLSRAYLPHSPSFLSVPPSIRTCLPLFSSMTDTNTCNAHTIQGLPEVYVCSATHSRSR